MQSTLISAPKADSFKLQEMPAGATPGISRTETDEAIEVTYQNRFSIYDESETA
jgi:hypothetical protein